MELHVDISGCDMHCGSNCRPATLYGAARCIWITAATERRNCACRFLVTAFMSLLCPDEAFYDAVVPIAFADANEIHIARVKLPRAVSC